MIQENVSNRLKTNVDDSNLLEITFCEKQR